MRDKGLASTAIVYVVDMLSITWPPPFALPFDQDLGRRLLALREYLDLSRPQLAHASGISVDKIRRLEMGERRCLIADVDVLLMTLKRLSNERAVKAAMMNATATATS